MAERSEIIAVTGFTRCGTSLMMRMLAAGGVPAYAENDVAFEHSDVLRLLKNGHDSKWLSGAHGHALKVLEPLYIRPFPKGPWRFILMHRDPDEQAKSQVKFFAACGTGLPAHAVRVIAESLRKDFPKMRAKLATRGPVLEIAFEDVLKSPVFVADRVAAFIGESLDTAAMERQIVPRDPECLPYMLELRQIRTAS